MEAECLGLPRNDLLRSDENTEMPELVVSRIVKVCKGACEWLVERKRLRRPGKS
jgi:hypothetical protein